MHIPQALRPLLIAAVLCPAPAAAQVVMSVQPLDFGPIIAGVTEVVPATDVARRADITVQGTGNGDASLSLLLPTTLNGSDGATIPLQFLAGDVMFQNPAGGQVQVNLTGSTTIRLHKTRAGHLYIGGRAIPAVGQPAGVYSTTIAIVIAPPGV